MKALIGVLYAFAFLASAGHGATLYVGSGEGCTTIQSAIDASSSGDLIIVRDGTYTGTGNRDIDFKGKAVHLKSENGPERCIIDAQGSYGSFRRVFIISHGESCTIEGLTVRGGFLDSSGGNPEAVAGGGVYCSYSSPFLLGNIFCGNYASYGAAIYINQGSPVICGNRFEDNGSSYYGGGCYIASSDRLLLAMNTFRRNWADRGGGLYLVGVPQSIVNNLFEGNKGFYYGGGVYTSGHFSGTLDENTFTLNYSAYGGGICANDSSPTISNSILWQNEGGEGAEACAVVSGSLRIRYSAVRGGRNGVYGSITWDVGNIDADPLFADPANGDYHLKSVRGRWSPTANGGAGGWVIDDVTSPCINAGDPASDYSNQPQPSRRIEMGAYGNTPEASKGKWILAGDGNGDSRVDVLDLIFVRNRLGQDVGTGENWKADVNEDGRINVLDLIFARNRLGTSRP